MLGFDLLVVSANSILNLMLLHGPLGHYDGWAGFLINGLAFRNRALTVGFDELKHHSFAKIRLENLRRRRPLGLILIKHLLHQVPKLGAVSLWNGSWFFGDDLEYKSQEVISLERLS